MNCRTAKSQIALWVGRDLDDADQKHVQGHLAECPNCSDYWLELKTSMDVVQQVRDDVSVSNRDSIWPAVQTRIAYQLHAGRLNRFNGWLPAAAVVAACLVLAVFINNPNDSTASRQIHRIDADPAELPPNFQVVYPDESWRRSNRPKEWPTEPDRRPIFRINDEF